MKAHLIGKFFSTLFLLFYWVSTFAQNITLEVGQHEKEATTFLLPFAFHTEALKTAVGLSAIGAGHFQPQASVFAAVFTTTNDSTAAYIGIQDAQLPIGERLFMTFYGSIGDYTNQQVYAGVNDAFPDERAGSNGSSNENNVQGEGDDDWFEASFKYLLPIGHAKKNPINKYYLKDGLLESGATGGDVWNPLKSGRVNFQLMLFQRYRSFLNEESDQRGKTTGIKYAIEYDNRDFKLNPTKGSLQNISLARDYGWSNSTDEWSAVQLDLRKYISFGSSEYFREQTLAVNFWTSYNPSWSLIQTDSGAVVDGRAPTYLGSSLGGFYRLKAYPTYRYSDKAAIYYSAEYRMIPKWSSFTRSRLLRPLDIDWVQIVPFVEFGRVATGWSVSTLHSDMKKVIGVGFRFMAQKQVFRLDTAVSDDAWSMWAMVGHPF